MNNLIHSSSSYSKRSLYTTSCKTTWGDEDNSLPPLVILLIVATFLPQSLFITKMSNQWILLFQLLFNFFLVLSEGVFKHSSVISLVYSSWSPQSDIDLTMSKAFIIFLFFFTWVNSISAESEDKEVLGSLAETLRSRVFLPYGTE